MRGKFGGFRAPLHLPRGEPPDRSRSQVHIRRVDEHNPGIFLEEIQEGDPGDTGIVHFHILREFCFGQRPNDVDPDPFIFQQKISHSDDGNFFWVLF